MSQLKIWFSKMKTIEQNIKKLSSTCIPMNFVKKNNGQWNHELWMGFCNKLEKKGYAPINFDQVGLLLEKKKKQYFTKKK
jgi:hypothetical protein